MMPGGRPPSCTCGVCKKCKHAAYMREWYRRKSLDERRAWIAKRDPEKVREADRARYYRHWEDRRARMTAWANDNREKVRAYNRAWVSRNPEKTRAHNALSNAIRDGKLERQPCEVCGKKADGHHDDYSKPLEARWLCRTHHMELHRRY